MDGDEFDMGGDVGGGEDMGSDLAGDYGGDARGDAGGDYGGTLAGDEGVDLNAVDIGDDLADNESVDLSANDLDNDFAGEEGIDLNADNTVEESPDYAADGSTERPIREFTDDPYDENGSLKPNVEYTTGEYDYNYETDDKGRISGFHTDNLQLTERENRLPHNSHTPDKGEGDDAGHVIGDRFGGSPELDNLVSQDSRLNRGDYKSMENEWAEAIRNGNQVQVLGELTYEGDSRRPSSYDVFYTIDGEMYEQSFLNRRD